MQSDTSCTQDERYECFFVYRKRLTAKKADRVSFYPNHLSINIFINKFWNVLQTILLSVKKITKTQNRRYWNRLCERGEGVLLEHWIPVNKYLTLIRTFLYYFRNYNTLQKFCLQVSGQEVRKKISNESRSRKLYSTGKMKRKN